MKKIFFLFFCTGFCILSNAQRVSVSVRNSTSETIWIVYGYNNPYNSFVSTIGWYKIEPHKTQYCCTLNSNDIGYIFYVHAQTRNAQRVTDGGSEFYVHPNDAFTIKYADRANTGEKHPEFEMRRFHRYQTAKPSTLSKLLSTNDSFVYEITTDMLVTPDKLSQWGEVNSVIDTIEIEAVEETVPEIVE